MKNKLTPAESLQIAHIIGIDLLVKAVAQEDLENFLQENENDLSSSNVEKISNLLQNNSKCWLVLGSFVYVATSYEEAIGYALERNIGSINFGFGMQEKCDMYFGLRAKKHRTEDEEAKLQELIPIVANLYHSESASSLEVEIQNFLEQKLA